MVPAAEYAVSAASRGQYLGAPSSVPLPESSFSRATQNESGWQYRLMFMEDYLNFSDLNDLNLLVCL